MKKLLVTTVAASVLFSGAAFAGDTYIQVAPSAPLTSASPGSYFIENVPVKQNPFDTSRLNESPIRGNGAIRVVHNDITAGQPRRAVRAVRAVCDDYPWSAKVTTAEAD